MDPNKQAEIIKMLKGGMSPMAISQEMGISAQTVRNLQKTSPVAQAAKARTTSLINEIAIGEDYEAGEKIPDIMEKHSITRSKLYQILSKFSIPTRQTIQKDTRKRAMDEAISMYKQGFVIRKIKEDTGVHQPTLHDELAKRGVPLRRPRAHNT